MGDPILASFPAEASDVLVPTAPVLFLLFVTFTARSQFIQSRSSALYKDIPNLRSSGERFQEVDLWGMEFGQLNPSHHIHIRRGQLNPLDSYRSS